MDIKKLAFWNRVNAPSKPKKLGLIHYLPKGETSNGSLKFIFIHGWGGSSSSWNEIHDKYFEEFSGSSIFFFNYGSGLKRLKKGAAENLLIDAQVLADDIRHLDEESEIVLLAHSQGGLAVLLAIRDLFERKNHSVIKRISCIVFYNTPFRGLGLGSILNRIPLFRQDSDYLKINDPKLADLGKFIERNFNFSEHQSDAKEIHLPAYGVVSVGDSVVSIGSAVEALPENNIKKTYGTHSSEINIKSGQGYSYDWVVEKIRLHIKNSKKNEIFDLDSDHGVADLVRYIKATHGSKKFDKYYSLLAKYSSVLKRKARHVELANLCELDLSSRDARNIYPIMTYSQCQLVLHNTIEAYESLKKVLLRDPSVKEYSSQVRLLFSRTLAEVLIAGGLPELSKKLLEGTLQDPRISTVRFRIVSHTLSILGRSYEACGLEEASSEVFLENLLEQELTDDDYGVAIASMNYGRSLRALGEVESSINHFKFALDVFKEKDVRASVWAELNLIRAQIEKLDTFDIKKLNSILEFYASTKFCSVEYLDDIQYIRDKLSEKHDIERIYAEITRCQKILNLRKIPESELGFIENAVDNLCANTPLHGANPLNSRVSIGGFKARSTLLKSFKRSLNRSAEAHYLKKISKNENFSANPFLNDVLTELCKKNPNLIEKHIIPRMTNIMLQTDSIIVFYSRFLESEGYDSQALHLLECVNDKKAHLFLNTKGNILSKKLKTLDEALDIYEDAIDSTEMGHRKAVVYNNMANAIHRHRRRSQYAEAIGYCKESIKCRTGMKFYYPAALSLALRIEQSSLSEIDDFLASEIKSTGLRGRSLKYMQSKIIDMQKRNYVARKIEENLTAI